MHFMHKNHCMHFQGKLMNQTWENSKKSGRGPDFGPFGPNSSPNLFFFVGFTSLDVRNCWKLSLYAVSRKTNESNLRKWQKT